VYASSRGIGAILSGEQEFAVQRAIAALPQCYSQGFDACINTPGGTDYPNCAQYNQAYDLDEEKMELAVANVPFCEPCSASPTASSQATPPSAAQPSSPWLWVAGGAAAALALGYVAWGRR